MGTSAEIQTADSRNDAFFPLKMEEEQAPSRGLPTRQVFPPARLANRLEPLRKYCRHSERGFLVFWRGFGEGAGLKNPVTEPKRRQKPERPLVLFNLPNGDSIYEKALAS
jgi:hypothetical protein